MGVFRIVLGAMRGASTLGVVAVDRLALDSARLVPRSARSVDPPGPGESGLDAFFPSQSENAALLDVYLERPRHPVT